MVNAYFCYVTFKMKLLMVYINDSLNTEFIHQLFITSVFLWFLTKFT